MKTMTFHPKVEREGKLRSRRKDFLPGWPWGPRSPGTPGIPGYPTGPGGPEQLTWSLRTFTMRTNMANLHTSRTRSNEELFAQQSVWVELNLGQSKWLHTWLGFNDSCASYQFMVNLHCSWPFLLTPLPWITTLEFSEKYDYIRDC